MANHYHIVCYLDPLTPQKWTDELVAGRLLLAYPGRLNESEMWLRYSSWDLRVASNTMLDYSIQVLVGKTKYDDLIAY